jgi:hypothetical protein
MKELMAVIIKSAIPKQENCVYTWLFRVLKVRSCFRRPSVRLALMDPMGKA